MCRLPTALGPRPWNSVPPGVYVANIRAAIRVGESGPGRAEARAGGQEWGAERGFKSCMLRAIINNLQQILSLITYYTLSAY